MFTSIILTIIAAVIVIVGKSTKKGIENREDKKDEIRTLLFVPVYVEDMTLEAAKVAYPDLWRKNPTLFLQYYQDLLSKRAADLENDIHPHSKKKNEAFYQRFLALGILVVLLLFINEIYN